MAMILSLRDSFGSLSPEQLYNAMKVLNSTRVHVVQLSKAISIPGSLGNPVSLSGGLPGSVLNALHRQQRQRATAAVALSCGCSPQPARLVRSIQ